MLIVNPGERLSTVCSLSTESTIQNVAMVSTNASTLLSEGGGGGAKDDGRVAVIAAKNVHIPKPSPRSAAAYALAACCGSACMAAACAAAACSAPN